MKHFFALFFIWMLAVSAGVSYGQQSSKSSLQALQPPDLKAPQGLTGLPPTMSYQGLITTSGGTPLDGSYDLQFDIFLLSTGGASLWMESHSGVTVQNGTFSVILGSTIHPLNIDFNQQLYVQVIATNGPTGPTYPLTFSPRSALTSAPSALAPWAVNATNNNISYTIGKVGIGTTDPQNKLHVRGSFQIDNPTVSHGFVWDNRSYVASSLILRSVEYGTNTTSTDNILVVDRTGNVGIGDTIPANKLHVRGGLQIENEGNLTYGFVWDNGLSGSLLSSLKLRSVTYGTNTTLTDNILLADRNGNIGIGTNSPVGKLHVNGSAGNNTGVWSNLSDRRLKKDIEPIAQALETVTQLKGVTFRWKDSKKDAEYGQVRGLIAQDVEKVLPEWVKTDPDGYKRLEPIGIDALLIEAIKEQQKEIEDLKAAVKALMTEKKGLDNKSLGELK